MAITTDDYLTIFDNLYSKINTNLTVEFNEGRINDVGYAQVLAQSLVQLINSSIGIYVNADKINAEVLSIDSDIALKNAQTVTESSKQANIAADTVLKGSQNAEEIADTIRKNDITADQLLKIEAETALLGSDKTVKDAQWAIQANIMDKQLDMITVDALNKADMVNRDLAIKTAQREQMEADADFTFRKSDVMENTRLDNVRMQAAREYGEYLKYISAAGVVPSSLHFDNLVNLITAISDKVDGSILTKKDILPTPTAVDKYGAYTTTVPSTYAQYFYKSKVDVSLIDCYRVGNVTCTATESGASATKCPS